MNIKHFMVIFGLLINCLVFAVSNNVSSDLFFLAKPVDPLCFSNLDSHSKRIDLKNCGLTKEKLMRKGENSHLIKDGFVGFDWQDPKASYPSQGYSYYKVFNAGNHQYWIYTLNNGGGSGDFTAINFVQVKKPGILDVNNLMAGDRCNGGIQEVKESNHHLFFSVNITAFDFLSLLNDNPHQLKAYDDLASCATCCAAKALYEVNSELQLKLKGVNLGAEAENPAEMSTQGRYQACFNTIIASYAKRGNFKLTHSQFSHLVKQFNSTCVE